MTSPVLYRDNAGEWRWKIVSDNGRIIAASSEGYHDYAAARRNLDLTTSRRASAIVVAVSALAALVALSLVVLLCGCTVTLPDITLPADPPAATNAAPPSVTNALQPATSGATNAQSSTNHPFAGRSIGYKRIDKGILEWAVTRQLVDVSISGGHVNSRIIGGDWKPMPDGLQGCWILAVEQPDGSIVIGTFDWNKRPHQTRKTLGNVLKGQREPGDEHGFFNVSKGCKVWFATSAPSRDNKRTVLERSNFAGPIIWPY